MFTQAKVETKEVDQDTEPPHHPLINLDLELPEDKAPPLTPHHQEAELEMLDQAELTNLHHTQANMEVEVEVELEMPVDQDSHPAEDMEPQAEPTKLNHLHMEPVEAELPQDLVEPPQEPLEPLIPHHQEPLEELHTPHHQEKLTDLPAKLEDLQAMELAQEPAEEQVEEPVEEQPEQLEVDLLDTNPTMPRRNEV